MSKLMKKSHDKKQIYQEQIFTCCFKYPVMNANIHRNTHRNTHTSLLGLLAKIKCSICSYQEYTHTHSNTHRNIHTHIWMGQCTLIRDGMSLDPAIRVLLQHLGTHTVQKPLLTLGSGVASLTSHQAASMPWGRGDPASISSSSAPDPPGTKTAQGPVHTWTPLQDQNR